MNMASILDIQDLSVDIPTDSSTLHAVRGISLELNRGETLGIVGESGSGKSMTALALMNLLPPAAKRQASCIDFDGSDLTHATERELASKIRGQRIGMIFQEPMTSLNPVYSIGRQLKETMTLHRKVSDTEAENRAVYLLEKVGLPDPASRLKQYPHELSGGQRQRVMIAMALMNEPELLIADEPTTALDVTIQAQILHLLRELQQEFGMSMILITHDLGVVSRAADNIAVMYAGDIVETGKTGEVLENPRHPYTKGLLECVPGYKGQSQQRLGAIPGIVPAMTGDISGCAFASRCPRAAGVCRTTNPPTKKLHQGRYFVCHEPDVEGRGLAAERPTASERTVTSNVRGTEDILTVDHVSCTFSVRRGMFGKRKPLQALDDVSLTLKKGEVLALVGESGCGKTTLTRTIMGLQAPSTGSVTLNGQRIENLPPMDRARMIQPIFQDPYSSLNPRKTIGEIIAKPLFVHGIGSNQEQHQQVRKMMELVGLPSRVFNSYPDQLSGGQRQRAAIGRALILNPEVVICDEPTSALDVSVQAQILNLLLDLRDELDLTYLFVTHNLSVVQHMADRVAVMYLGEIVECGERDQVMSDPKHPYTHALMNSALSISPGESVPDPGLSGDFPNPMNRPSGCPFHPRCPLADQQCREQAPGPELIDNTLVQCWKARTAGNQLKS
ncbi:ABC transporter ATP-binding protein [Marinobacter adhaerens]|jgi:peptide/nickel transport system ATP-binding protein|uniref:ABC transporter ATP-binding protein n=3 Tax=Marinobacter adhaerens TaxID=1033846 RepID=A0ABX8IFH5_9GAMM|nr:oligopeptide/dipeptide ABC transporter, ATP-binding protein-like protein [Marinobacter adhaerens HP15]MBW4976924.1 ABC transporter ATP-binding protein [Marinobacter adhaerens]QWV12561.1 ABC transporter ATP-binding protein [Marinobacter adhaerens]